MVVLLAVVDSGAARSFFPLAVADQLGIAGDELKRDDSIGEGVGSSFETWSSTVPIRGQVITMVESEPDFWGPEFALNPAFANADAMLLGRGDFFRAFVVTFEEDHRTPIFHLDSKTG